jgi:hypothetical protein
MPRSRNAIFNSSPEVIRLVVMMDVRFPLSLRNVEDLLFERGIDICMRRYGCGGTGSGRCSQVTFAGSGCRACAVSSLALASRRDVREAEWRNGLPLASSRS